MKTYFFLTAIFIFTGFRYVAGQASPKVQLNKNGKTKKSLSDTRDWYFKLDFTKDEKLSNIFSRAIAYHGDAFVDVVQRISGTGLYTVIGNDPESPAFESRALYDGRPEGKGNYTIRTDGRTIYNGKPYQDNSASGLLYNSFIWGVPPDNLHEGDQWETVISEPWELGGPGKQTVTVMQLDKLHHSIMLKREGTGEGFYDSDAKQIIVTLKDGKKIKMNIQPGKSSWSGYTTIRKGVIISDELLVTRPIILKNDSLSLSGAQREYILLNAMPSE